MASEAIQRVRAAETKRREMQERTDKLKEEIRRSNIWEKACLDAASTKGEFNLYRANFGSIDPLLFNFEKNFGLVLRQLRLVGMGLHELPGELCSSLPKLELLNLGSNHLITLPDEIVQMTCLTELLLPQNKLVYLPDRIGLLCSLERFELPNNKLEKLPITFGGLARLRKIEIECNNLVVLPENLNNMLCCEVINCNQNKLIRLPRCIGRMPSLTSLSAARNQITYIPQEIADCVTLKILRLPGNGIPFLPEDIGNCTRLRELCMDYNDLRMLPMSFHKLKKLKLFRVEGNKSLSDPPPDVLDQGAVGVLKYMHDKFAEDEYWRMKRIVTSMQNVLKQVDERAIADPSLFHARFMIDVDPWYAVDIDYLWKDLIPALRAIWKKEGGKKGSVRPGYVNSFPFEPQEVNWALTRFQDAYGSMFRRQTAWFTRCSCADEEGRRKPCVPPAPGFMCERVSTLIKCEIIVDKIRKERLWQDYMSNGVNDAVVRAKHEAESYLRSVDGSLWLSSLAYEKAEELLDEGGANSAVEWRTRAANRRKLDIVRRYDRKKRRIERVRDKKAKQIQDNLADAKEQFRLAREGYMKKTISFQIDNLTRQLAQLPENVEILKLQLKCEKECKDVDEDFFGDISTTEDEESSESSATDSDGEDEETKARRQKRRQKKARDKVALDALRAELAEEHKKNAKRTEQLQEIERKLEERRELEALGMIPEESDLPLQLRKTKIQMIQAAKLLSIPRNIERELERKKMYRRYVRSMRYAKDMVDIRLRKMFRTFNGTFDETQKELEHELYFQYVTHHVAMARRKAESEFEAMDTIRNNWEGLGAKLIFMQWKEFVRTKKRRARRDLRFYWRIAVRSFEACMESVRIAEAQVAMWDKCINVYTDEPFYRNRMTDEITLEKPDIKHYLPPFFVIAAPPPKLPPGMSMDTSSEESDGGKVKTVNPDKKVKESRHEKLSRRALMEYNRKVKDAKKAAAAKKKKDSGNKKKTSLLNRHESNSQTNTSGSRSDSDSDSNSNSNSEPQSTPRSSKSGSGSGSESDEEAGSDDEDESGSESEESEQSDEAAKEEARDSVKLPPIHKQGSMGSLNKSGKSPGKKAAQPVVSEQHQKYLESQARRKMTMTQKQEMMTETLRAHQRSLMTPNAPGGGGSHKKDAALMANDNFFDDNFSLASGSTFSANGTGNIGGSPGGTGGKLSIDIGSSASMVTAPPSALASTLKARRQSQLGYDSPTVSAMHQQNTSSSAAAFAASPLRDSRLIANRSRGGTSFAASPSGRNQQLVPLNRVSSIADGILAEGDYQRVGEEVGEDEDGEGDGIGMGGVEDMVGYGQGYDQGGDSGYAAYGTNSHGVLVDPAGGYDGYEGGGEGGWEGDESLGGLQSQVSMASSTLSRPSDFSYGPDSLRMRRTGGSHSRFNKPLFQVEPVVEEEDELHERLEVAKSYMQTEEYRNTTVALPDVNKSDLAEVKANNIITVEEEIDRAERIVKKKRNAVSVVKHNTYMNQLNKKTNRTAEEVKADHEEEVANQKDTTEYQPPSPQELLNLVGGDTRMTWVKGQEGFHLRNVLTLRALHVKKRLFERAVEEGRAKPKRKSFWDRHIRPMFTDTLIASSSEDEEEKLLEAREKRKEARQAKRAHKEETRRRFELAAKERAEKRAAREGGGAAGDSPLKSPAKSPLA